MNAGRAVGVLLLSGTASLGCAVFDSEPCSQADARPILDRPTRVETERSDSGSPIEAKRLESGAYAVHYTPAFQALTPFQQRFLEAHEIGHIRLGHLDEEAARPINAIGKNSLTDLFVSSRRRELELEADCYAARALWPELGLHWEDIIDLYAQMQGGVDHPSSTARLQELYRCARTVEWLSRTPNDPCIQLSTAYANATYHGGGYSGQAANRVCYHLEYTNVCERRLDCTLRVVSGYLTLPERALTPFETRIHLKEIDPGATFTIRDELMRYTSSESEAAVLYPGSPEDLKGLVSCKPI